MPDTDAPRQLDIPPEAAGSASAVEVLRAWIVDGQLHLSLDSAFPTPETWGLLLADVARRAARTFAADENCGEREALSRIEWALEAELESPTDRSATPEPNK